MMDVWDKLYAAAEAVRRPRELSPLVQAGGVAAALETKTGSLYAGVCIDAACALGMCAERNAAANMLTHGESEIVRLTAVMPDGRAGPPCGACREFLMQLNKNNGAAEVLLDYPARKIVKLSELLPSWWGEEERENR